MSHRADLDVTAVECHRDHPPAPKPDALPPALADLSDLLAIWHARTAMPLRTVDAALSHFVDRPQATEHCPLAPPAPSPPPPWRIEWSSDFLTLDPSTQPGSDATKDAGC